MKEKILERIKKYLSIGKDKRNTNLAEINAAMDMAEKLMAKYNIRLSEVPADQDTFNITRDTALKKRTLCQWEKILISAAGNLFTIKAIISSGPAGQEIVFLGVSPEQTVAAIFYNNLRKTVRSMANATGYRTKEKTAYINGLVLSIDYHTHKIAQQREAEELNGFTKKENEACRSVIIKKTENLDKHMATLDLEDVNPPGRINTSGGAFMRGVKDGQNVDLKTRCILEKK